MEIGVKLEEVGWGERLSCFFFAARCAALVPPGTKPEAYVCILRERAATSFTFFVLVVLYIYLSQKASHLYKCHESERAKVKTCQREPPQHFNFFSDLNR